MQQARRLLRLPRRAVLQKHSVTCDCSRHAALFGTWSGEPRTVDNHLVFRNLKRWTSEEMRDALEQAAFDFGYLSRDEVEDAYLILLTRLRIEGDEEAVQELVEVSMPSVGLEMSKAMSKVLHLTDEVLMENRTEVLNSLLQQGNVLGLRAAFDKIKEFGQANTTHFNVMLRACNSAAEMKELIDKEMPRARAKPDTDSFRLLVYRLRLEGDDKTARAVVDVMVPSAGLEADKYMQQIMALSEEDLGRQRIGWLRTELAKRNFLGVNSALQIMKINKKADTIQMRTFIDQYEAGELIPDVATFNLMLEACETAAAMRELIEQEMPRAGVKPNHETFYKLATQLRAENDEETARDLVKLAMPLAGVEASPEMQAQFLLSDERISELRRKMMRNLLPNRHCKRTEETVEAARAILAKAAENGKARTVHFNVMMVACSTAAEMIKLIEEDMVAARVKPDVVTFTKLLDQLYLEGDEQAAEEIRARGRIDKAVLATRNHQLARMTTLQELTKQGPSQNLDAANALFERMKHHGKANEFHFGVMMTTCGSAAEMKKVLTSDMRKAGVEPNSHHYCTLLRRLHLEGDHITAREVVDVLMPSDGVEPDEHVQKIMSTSEAIWRKRSTVELQASLTGGKNIDAAELLFDRLKKNGKADIFHFNTMLKTCNSATEVRQIINKDMPRAGVKPDIFSFNMLLLHLRLEGDIPAVEKLVNVTIPKAGIKEDKVFRRTLTQSTYKLSRRAGRMQGSSLVRDIRRRHGLRKLMLK